MARTSPTSSNYCCYTTLWKSKNKKCNITVGYYQRKLHQMDRIASSKWTCRLYNLGCYAAMCVRNKDMWHRWPAKTLDANLVWLWTEHYRGCDWPVAWPSDIMCACWWWKFRTQAVKLLFICIMWFVRTFYETVIVIWCIWWLFCS